MTVAPLDDGGVRTFERYQDRCAEWLGRAWPDGVELTEVASRALESGAHLADVLTKPDTDRQDLHQEAKYAIGRVMLGALVAAEKLGLDAGDCAHDHLFLIAQFQQGPNGRIPWARPTDG